jgi:transcriptional regulator with PAS, ATPase and Fis domain
MIYQSPQMYNIAERCRSIAQKDKDVSFLLLGESGAGKNVLAHYIHDETPTRCDYSFVEASLSREDSLLDSELFGYVKGAFTGAVLGHDGAFTRANGGTVFLDEIDNLSLLGQSKILKVTDEWKYLPVGGNDYLKADVRIITATNKPVEYLMDKTYFRTDLYYRIGAVNVVIPPLRERVEDMVPLAESYINGWNEQHHTSYVLGEYDKSLLVDYPFPGNVRELNSVVRYAALLSETDFNTNALAERLSQPMIAKMPESVSKPAPDLHVVSLSLSGLCQRAESIYIKKVLRDTKYNISRASEVLKISRPTLRKKIKLYGLDRPPDKSFSSGG